MQFSCIVAGQAQLAPCMTWLDPIDDREVTVSGKLDCSQGASKHLGSILHKGSQHG